MRQGWHGLTALRWAPLLVLALGLAAMAVIQVRWAVAFVRWPLEIMYGEALIVDHAARIVHGQALYQPLGQPSYSLASYTPVFYALLAATQTVFGPSLTIGRVISLSACVLACALLGLIAAGRGRGAWAGGLAALLFVALGFPTPFPWFALAKEDMLGITFGLASVAVLVRSQTQRSVGLAGLLAALAILTKQTLFAAAVAGTVALAVTRPRLAPWFVAATLAPVLVTLGALEATTHAFVDNAIFGNAQPVRADVFLTNLATLKAYQAGVAALAAIAVLRRLWQRASFEDVLLPVYVLAASVPILGLAAIGSAQNYWIEFAAAASVLAATETWTWLRHADARVRLVGAALALLPLVNVVVAGRLALIWLPALSQYDQRATARATLARLVERVRETPGDVIAEPLDVIALAGKPVLVEPWAADALYQTGTWNISPLVDRVCRGEIGLAVMAHSLDEQVSAYNDFGIWPRPLIRALQQAMIPQGDQTGRWVYTAASGSREDCPAGQS